MGWFDHQEIGSASASMKEEKQTDVEIQMPGGNGEWLPVNKNQVKRIYADDLGGALLIVVDEVAELLTPSRVNTEAGKEEDAMRQECSGLIQSITQLGRSAGIHCVLATQRNDSKIISGVIQNNPVSLDTKVIIRRKIKQ